MGSVCTGLKSPTIRPKRSISFWVRVNFFVIEIIVLLEWQDILIYGMPMGYLWVLDIDFLCKYYEQQIWVYIILSMQKDETFSDMCEMLDLNEATILNNLISRYQVDRIFTYIGPTLLAVNPYRPIPELFSPEAQQQILSLIKSGNTKQLPHIFMIAGKAFLNMKNRQPKQSILISGESGAGKTQSTKYCMQMLTLLNFDSNSSIPEKILACNPILQAFGNSKTVRNENSSRFGKYVKMFFGKRYDIRGAAIESYLLEKSRVSQVPLNERNFHVFYSLTKTGYMGAEKAENYEYLSRSGCYEAKDIDDESNFHSIQKALMKIGFSKEQEERIWRLLLVILQLGNINFLESNGGRCRIKSSISTQQLSNSLGTTELQLEQALTTSKITVGKQTFINNLDQQRCKISCDTLSRTLYSKLFDFVIDRIQISLRPQKDPTTQDILSLQQSTILNYFYQINLLDIFGFQKFQDNSIEQICINFANQKLLDQYNKTIFENQMAILKEDGLEDQAESIIIPTNKPTIDLVGKVFRVISETTQLFAQKSSEETEKIIIDKLQKEFGNNSTLIRFPPTNKKVFSIQHSPSRVAYNVTGFKIKNQDKVTPDVDKICQKVFKTNKEEALVGKGKKKEITLLQKFSSQIEELIGELSQTTNHFVRCIKPNQLRKAKYYDSEFLKIQIKYLGVFETIKIRKAIFPYRKTFQQFRTIFQGIYYRPIKGKTDRDATLSILQLTKSEKNQFLLGNKRVYINQQLEARIHEILKQFHKQRNEKAVVIQRNYRIHRERVIYFRNLRKCITDIKRSRSVKKIQIFLQRKLKQVSEYGLLKMQVEAEEKQELQRSQIEQQQRMGQKTQPNKLISEENRETEKGRSEQQTNLNSFRTKAYIYLNNDSSSKIFQQDFDKRAQQTINLLQDKQKMLTLQIARLQKQNSEKDKHFQQLNLNLFQQARQKSEVIHNLQQQVRRLSIQAQQLNNQKQILLKTNHQKENKIQEMTQENQTLKLENKTINAELLSLRDELEAKCKQLRQFCIFSEQQLLLQQKRQQQSKQIFKIHQELQLQKKKSIEHSKRERDLQDMVKKYDKIIQNYKKDYQKYREQKQALHKMLNEKLDIIKVLKEEKEAKSKISNSLQRKKTVEKADFLLNLQKSQSDDNELGLGRELTMSLILKNENDSLKMQLALSKQTIQGFQKSLRKLNGTLNELRDRHISTVAEFQNKLNLAKKKDDLSISKISQYKKQLQKSKKNQQQLFNKLSSQQEKINAFEAQIPHLQERVNLLNAEIITLKYQRQQLQNNTNDIAEQQLINYIKYRRNTLGPKKQAFSQKLIRILSEN